MSSDDSVSYDIQSLFYQGAYEACIESVQQNARGSPSDPVTQLRLLYGARSHIALNNPAAAIALLPSSSINTAAAQSIRGLAKYVQAQIAKNAGKAEEALGDLNELLDQAAVGDANGQTIRVCVATAMARDEDPVGALEVLSMGTCSSREIECIALGVHILLSINRADIAQKEYAAARKWADDSLLIQLIEAYLGIYSGGRTAQQAYYVYDELAQNPNQANKPSSVPSLIGKAVAKMVSGDYIDADAILTEAQGINTSDAEVLANKVSLAYATAKTAQSDALLASLSAFKTISPSHPLLVDYEEKANLFDEALRNHKEALSTAS